MKRIFLFFFSLFLLLSIPPVFATPENNITIFLAKKIITMDPNQPQAKAVAVKEGRIYSVGSLETLRSSMKKGSYTIDTRFANAVITPGMIEAHCHFSLLSIFPAHPYLGYYDFPGFNGSILAGAKTKDAVLKHLKEADKKAKNANTVIFAWGYDPIFHHNENLTAADLDQVSTTRPIFVLNASEHIAYVNTVLLKKAGYNAQTTRVGVVKGKDGNPNGVLEEINAMGPVLESFFSQLISPAAFKSGVYAAADLGHRVGLTTMTDMFFGGPAEKLITQTYQQAAHDTHFPVRIVPAYSGSLLYETQGADKAIAYIQNLQKLNSNKLRFGNVKFISDGSIQGFTARLKWPGYFNGAANGIFNTTTEVLKQQMLPFWQAGLPIHVHTNGDQATDSALATLAYLQLSLPRKEPRFILEHNQMASPEQFRRAALLGAQTNLFANQIYYWGDQHYAITMGSDRANRMDDAAEAKRAGLIFSLHTDSPVSPLGPLHSMWSAVNRITASGRVLGESERISAYDALRAVTLNAAYLLQLEKEIGSIEIGKRADFTVLAKDPLAVAPKNIKDIKVLATIQDGRVYSVK